MASSRNAPYFRLLFIAIEEGVLSISVECFLNLGGILSKPFSFFSINILKVFLNFNRISRLKAKRYWIWSI